MTPMADTEIVEQTAGTVDGGGTPPEVPSPAPASSSSGLPTWARRSIIAVVLLSALLAGLGWNIFTWYLGLPSSSSHALIGGLVGAGLVMSGLSAINWGGLDGWKPVGVFRALSGLAVSPALGAAVAWLNWDRPAPTEVLIDGYRSLRARANPARAAWMRWTAAAN